MNNTECQIVVALSLRSLILIHSHWLVEETTHVQLYTQWWDIVLPRVTLNQSFQSVSYPPLVPVYSNDHFSTTSICEGKK